MVRIRLPPAGSQERTRIPRPGSGAGFRVMGLVDRALRLNPSFARGWYLSGILRDPGVVTLAPARIERFAAVLDAQTPQNATCLILHALAERGAACLGACLGDWCEAAVFLGPPGRVHTHVR